MTTTRVAAEQAATRAAAQLMQRMSVDVLLRSAYSITHQMHAAADAAQVEVEAELRARRDLIDAEIVRRTTKGA